MTNFSNRTDARAHQVIRNLSTSLAMKGALPPEAARQMCDGFVSKANLLQAQQAMGDARRAGDGNAYRQAAHLHQALGVALRFQDAQATRVEGRNDARESLRANDARDVFGSSGVVRDNDGPSLGGALLVGALVAGAIALMSGGHRDDNDRIARNRIRR